MVEKISLIFLFVQALSTAGICEKSDNSLQYFLRNDGASTIEINLRGSLQNPAWSPPDGQSILFIRFRGEYNQEPADIFITELENKFPRLLVSDGSGNMNLPGSVWNARTHQIIFSSSREPHNEIFVINEKGNPGDEIKIADRDD